MMTKKSYSLDELACKVNATMRTLLNKELIDREPTFLHKRKERIQMQLRESKLIE